MLTFKKVTTGEEIKETAQLAYNIWNQHFVSIIGQAQTDYMLENFQSENAMTKQIEDGYEYFQFILDNKPIGYFGVCKEEDNTLFLSKLYLKKEYRGRGYARQAFEFIKGLAKGYGNKSIWLTVNKYNDNTIAVYKKFGMKIIRSQVTDIGNGFVMDDYVFEYEL